MGLRVVVAVVAAVVAVTAPAGRAAADDVGLRWTGDARVAGNPDGTVLGGPSVRFRFGMELRERYRPMETMLDVVFGSWGGLEVSFSVLTGAVRPDTLGTALAIGVGPWLSRRQHEWFLDTQRISVLGVLLPEVGVVYGLGGQRLWLGWEVPIGTRQFQIVPGVSWISPGGDQRLLGSLSFRVPM